MAPLHAQRICFSQSQPQHMGSLKIDVGRVPNRLCTGRDCCTYVLHAAAGAGLPAACCSGAWPRWGPQPSRPGRKPVQTVHQGSRPAHRVAKHTDSQTLAEPRRLWHAQGQSLRALEFTVGPGMLIGQIYNHSSNAMAVCMQHPANVRHFLGRLAVCLHTADVTASCSMTQVPVPSSGSSGSRHAGTAKSEAPVRKTHHVTAVDIHPDADLLEGVQQVSSTGHARRSSPQVVDVQEHRICNTKHQQQGLG